MTRKRLSSKPKTKPASPNKEDALAAVINKGAAFPDPEAEAKPTTRRKGRPPSRVPKKKVLLTVPEQLLVQLDEHLEQHQFSGTRSDWLRAAIEAQLKREAKT